jgi:hypothetical protein
VLGKLLGSAKCKVGKHEGEWRLVSPSRCELVQICERCGNERQKVEHAAWSSWEFTSERPDECEVERYCGRCREKDTGFRHEWSDWGYVRDGSCLVERVCSRCREKESDVRHAEPRVVYVRPDECLQGRICSRCEKSLDYEDSSIQHVWGEFAFSPERNTAVRVCGRCGNVDEREREEAQAAADNASG